MRFRKLWALSLCLALTLTGLAGCGGGDSSSGSGATSGATSGTTSGSSGDAKPYVAVISKGFQHQFWQVVRQGAQDAATEYGVEITFEGPATESDINDQVNMFKSAMNKNPSAICLAALDTSSVNELLQDCINKGIPVVGFDSGVPNAPEGAIYATASTDNYAAARIAAEHLFENEAFQSRLAEGHMVVGVLSQEATSDSIVKRTSGFIDRLVELVEGLEGYADAVEVVGHDTFARPASADIRLTVQVNVPASTASADMKSGADTLLAVQNLIAVYGSNENAAGGILAASNDGADFAEGGKFSGILAIGFDAGKTQRTAVENGWFYGSITQDPYSIGWKAVELAVDALRDKDAASEIVDTGAKWYDAAALEEEPISQLVYE